MPFFVTIYQEAWPDRVQELLTAIRNNFAATRTVAPGRQNGRVFQHLHEPTKLLSLGEWDNQASFEALRASPAFVTAVSACGPVLTIEYLQRLHAYQHMNQQPAVIACATISSPVERLAETEAFLRGPAQRRALAAPGLVSREFYRGYGPDGPTGNLLVVHGWRSLADLARYRELYTAPDEIDYRSFGATIDRFTGAIAIEYSGLDRVDRR